MAPPPAVSVTPVVSRQVTETGAFIGRVTAIDKVDLVARVGELVIVEEIQKVRAGQVVTANVVVSVSGYLIGSQAAGKMPLPPKAEFEWWYQYYFATERGRAGYDKNRHDFAKLIWQLASPKWNFDVRHPSTIPITWPS